MTTVLHQSVNTIDGIYAQAAMAMPYLVHLLEDIAVDVGATLIIPPLKTQSRSIEKNAD